jgi:hypothetical protein
MSYGQTWTSPRLNHPTSRAVNIVPPMVAAAVLPTQQPRNHPGAKPSEIIRPVSALRPVSAKTIGALESFQARQYSSFAVDGCFPCVVGVRDPFLGLHSPMTRQLATRERRLKHRQHRNQQLLDHSACTTQLELLRTTSALELRPESALSDSQITNGSPTALLNGSLNLDEDETTKVPVLRTEIPLASHPLVSRPGTAAAGAKRNRSAAANRTPQTVPFEMSPADTSIPIITTTTVHGHVAPLLPRATRKPMQWSVGTKRSSTTTPIQQGLFNPNGAAPADVTPRLAGAVTPAAEVEDVSVLAAETIDLMRRAATPGIETRSRASLGLPPRASTPTPSYSSAKDVAVSLNGMLRETLSRPASAAPGMNGGSAANLQRRGGPSVQELGSDSAYRPLLAFVR